MLFISTLQGTSLPRLKGIIRKEFILIMRDRGTIAMLVIMPIMLLIVFGFAISLDPKNLPTAIISEDHTPLTRYFISDLKTSGYFNIVDTSGDVSRVMDKIARGEIRFAISIPGNFTRKYIRGENPEILVDMDGTDPGSSATALGHVRPILDLALDQFGQRDLNVSKPQTFSRSVNLVTHQMYNEANLSSYDIIPGLIGVLITITMVMLTSTAITSEFESGTMEMLLSTPLRPTEIILGKIIPYILLGYLQLTTVVLFGKLLIHIPIEGSLLLLYLAAAPFIIANLMVGMIFSTIASTPMQAMQLSTFYQLPSMFLSGYVFSFYGMPQWAQSIGYCLPMTYFMRISRGVLLKGNTMLQILPNVLPIILIAVILIFLTKMVFRRTLD